MARPVDFNELTLGRVVIEEHPMFGYAWIPGQGTGLPALPSAPQTLSHSDDFDRLEPIYLEKDRAMTRQPHPKDPPWVRWQKMPGEAEEGYKIRLASVMSEMSKIMAAEGGPSMSWTLVMPKAGSATSPAAPKAKDDVVKTDGPSPHQPLHRALRADCRRQPGMVTLESWRAFS